MKHSPFSALVLSCCTTVILSCTVVSAQRDNPCGRTWQTPLEEVKGEVLKIVDKLMLGTRKEGRHLLMKVSAKEMVVIHVFPMKCIKNNPDRFDFTIGETVKVTGSEFFTGKGGGQRNICAQSIPSRNLFDLRDEYDGTLNSGEYCSNKDCEERCAGRSNMACCMEGCEKGIPGGGGCRKKNHLPRKEKEDPKAGEGLGKQLKLQSAWAGSSTSLQLHIQDIH